MTPIVEFADSEHEVRSESNKVEEYGRLAQNQIKCQHYPKPQRTGRTAKEQGAEKSN